MSKKLKVGVIGVGHLGKFHGRIYSEFDTTQLVGLCDIDEKRGKKFARKYKTEFVSNPDELARRVDAVSIATPTETHYEIARQFLKSGVHTLVEKPITQDSRSAAELVELAEKNGLVLQVGHVERYNSAVKKAREYINKPEFIEVNRISKFPDRSLDIGVVLDLMIHDIDIILSFVNSPVKKLDAIGTPVFSDKEDIANCRLEFKNGCVANITASRVSYKSERKIRVFEGDRYLSLDYEKQNFVVYKKKQKEINSPRDVKRISPRIKKTQPLQEELKDFITSIKEEKEPRVTGKHGLTALKLAIDITKSL
ncbi:MAG: Gfo/Idh/MocA family protein [Elusimicrobiota bacterium]